MKYKKAIETINKNGILLVFPVNNKSEPDSLWSHFYPNTKLEWNWDKDIDNRVSQMWSLMKRLSACREVVYSKWYQGRATFFSRSLFTALLKLNMDTLESNHGLSKTGLYLLEILENDSPLSTKQIKKISELQGKDNEKIYQKAINELFKNFHIIAYGEVDDGAFPSLALGSTKNIYEEMWFEAKQADKNESLKIIDKFMPKGQLFRKYLEK